MCTTRYAIDGTIIIDVFSFPSSNVTGFNSFFSFPSQRTDRRQISFGPYTFRPCVLLPADVRRTNSVSRWVIIAKTRSRTAHVLHTSERTSRTVRKTTRARTLYNGAGQRYRDIGRVRFARTHITRASYNTRTAGFFFSLSFLAYTFLQSGRQLRNTYILYIYIYILYRNFFSRRSHARKTVSFRLSALHSFTISPALVMLHGYPSLDRHIQGSYIIIRK